MKQGIRQVMPVLIGLDLDTVEAITFKFSQVGSRPLIFKYPSENAERLDVDNVVHLTWTPQQSRQFKAGREIRMDTLIEIKDSSINPETAIVSFTMDETLFEPMEDKT